MASKPMSATDRAFRERWGLGHDDPIPTSLPKVGFLPDQSRQLEAEHYATDVAGGSHSDVLAGDSRFDGLDAGDPAPRIDGDYASLDDKDGVVTMSFPKLSRAAAAMAGDRESRNVTYRRIWAVPGNGQAAKAQTRGPNGKAYSDGRFSPEGAYRKRGKGAPKPHYGIDLPAASDTAVVAADSGTIMSPVPDPEGKGFGNNVVIKYDSGPEQGLYGHLGPGEAPRIGSHVQQGQKIGVASTSGNARGQGDHLHYEVRKTLGDRTWRKQKAGGSPPVDPTDWTNRRVSRRRLTDN